MGTDTTKLQKWTSKIYSFLEGIFEEEDEEEVFIDLTALNNALTLIRKHFHKEKMVWNLLKLIDLLHIVLLWASTLHTSDHHWIIPPLKILQGLRQFMIELISFSR